MTKPLPPKVQAVVDRARKAIARVDARLAGEVIDTPADPGLEAVIDVFVESELERQRLENARKPAGWATRDKSRSLPGGVDDAILQRAVSRVLESNRDLCGLALTTAALDAIQWGVEAEPADKPAYNRALSSPKRRQRLRRAALRAPS